MNETSVTQWLDGLQRGEESAANRLWQEYFTRITALARKKLAASPRRATDEEDVAISAFNSFCQNAAQGKFPELKDEDGLWRLLFTIVERKSIRQMQHERRLKRGGGQVRGESVFGGAGTTPFGIEQFRESPEPTAESVVVLAESVDQLLNSLTEDNLRKIAVAKMEGYTNEEIAAQLNCSDRSVKRKLKVIRTLWAEHAANTNDQ